MLCCFAVYGQHSNATLYFKRCDQQQMSCEMLFCKTISCFFRSCVFSVLVWTVSAIVHILADYNQQRDDESEESRLRSRRKGNITSLTLTVTLYVKPLDDFFFLVWVSAFSFLQLHCFDTTLGLQDSLFQMRHVGSSKTETTKYQVRLKSNIPS